MTVATDADTAVRARTTQILDEERHALAVRIDRLFATLMAAQWAAGVAVACGLSPRAWAGTTSSVHLHVWAAVVLGPLVAALPIGLAVARPGTALTRHVIAVGQMLSSALLIHLSGGRIETHFHVFGSLAFLAMYRDRRVLVTAATVIIADHLVRGAWWPHSVYGVATGAEYRWLEHGAWVAFECVFLAAGCGWAERTMRASAEREAALEHANACVEARVRERTAALAASEERFRTLSTEAPIGIFATDTLGRPVYTNPRCREIVGDDVENQHALGWLGEIHPDDRDAVHAAWRAAIATASGCDGEFRVRVAGGSPRVVRARVAPVLDGDGMALAWVGTLDDVTAWRAAERERADEARVAAALLHVGDVLSRVLDTRTVLDRVSDLAAELLDCDTSGTWALDPARNEFTPITGCLMRQPGWETLREVRIPRASVQPLLEVVERVGVLEVERAAVQGTVLGELMRFLGLSRCLVAAMRRGRDVVAVQAIGHRGVDVGFTDVDRRIVRGIANLATTALSNAELVEALERTSRLKSEFVSTMSHELRTPLHVIVGYADILAETSSARDELGRIRKAAVDLLALVDTTLDVGRIEAGRDGPRFAEVALADVWDALEAEFAALTRGDAVTLRWAPVAEERLITDRRKLEQILRNLIGNALKFTGRGEVAVACTVDDASCHFSVHDTGIGIPADELPHVFDMFRQVDGSDARSYGGVGLGLYVVKRLVEQLGGTVDVESRFKSGTTFRVALPRAPRVADAASGNGLAEAALAS